MKPSCNLVIGASGFIGQSLVPMLNESNTFFLSKNKKKKKINQNHFFIDINNKKNISAFLNKLDKNYKKITIYFLAGESSVEDSIQNPEKSFLNSINGFTNILANTSKKHSIIISSSGSLYDSREKIYFKENDSLYPPSAYAASKIAIEGLALSYFESFGLDIKIARIFSVFGENMERFFIYDLVKKIKSNPKKIILNGSGQQFRDFLHVNDVAKGLKLISSKGKAGEIYNLCSGNKIKLDFLSKKIKKILNEKKTEIEWDKRNYKGIRDSWYGNNSKIKKIGFKYENLENKIDDTIKAIYSKI
jgi:UDP-glucose 4-epimerase